MQKNDIIKLEKAGIDKTELIIQINLINILPDVINSLSWSFEQKLKKAGLYIQIDKKNNEALKNLTSKLTKNVDCILKSDDISEKFADDSDEIYNLLMDYCKKQSKK